MVEDEPVHEFYANLTNTTTRSYGKLNAHSFHRSRACDTIHDSSKVKLICNRNYDDDDGIDKKSDFSQSYKRALSSPAKLSSLTLDASNKGYQMLSRSMGWKESDGGLGRNRQGSLTPIKTQLKKFKSGLGYEKKSLSRVTHTQPFHCKSGVSERNNSETKSKKRKLKGKEAERERIREEKRLRIMLNSDFSPQCEELLLGLL